MHTPFVVIDVGGTYIRWANWDPNNGLDHLNILPTPSFHNYSDRSVNELQQLLLDIICQIPTYDSNIKVGLSFGAAIDHINGSVYASAPLWGSHNEPFSLLNELFSKRPDVAWYVVNDVTAALLHAVSLPLCAQDKKVMLITISTGIAARIIDRTDLKISFDACGLQGEIGHLPAKANIEGEAISLNCDCGNPDHLAAFSSGRGIAQVANVIKHKYKIDWDNSILGLKLFNGEPFNSAFKNALIENDRIALLLLDTITSPIADILRTSLCLFPDIDRIILTGGVSTSLDHYYLNSVISHLNQDGIYITSKNHPKWVSERISIVETNCLIGAGITALKGLKYV